MFQGVKLIARTLNINSAVNESLRTTSLNFSKGFTSGKF